MLCGFLVLSIASLMTVQTIEAGVNGTQLGARQTATIETISGITDQKRAIDYVSEIDTAGRNLARSVSIVVSRKTEIVKITVESTKSAATHKVLTYQKHLD